VKFLAAGFRNFYSSDKSIRVFSRDFDRNRKYINLNELLYDVCVCRLELVPPDLHAKNLYYVKEALWQVESEFSNNRKHALVDFSKLIIGCAENKLFIGQQVNNINSFLDILLQPARECSGRVFLCLLPHPKRWDAYIDFPRMLWNFSRGRWNNLELD
jgi:hypothetical protein